MRNILPYLIIAVLAILLFRQCDKTNDIQDKSDNKDKFLNDTITYYKDKLGQEIASKTALNGDNESLSVLLSKERDQNGQLGRIIDKMKADAAGHIGIDLRIDTVYIPYDVPVPCEFVRKWSKKDKWYNIEGVSNQNGITINSIEIPAQISFAIGSVKTGLFEREYQFKATVDNPNIKITQLDGYTAKVPQKRLGVSIFAGYGFSSAGLGPIAGIGLDYQVFRF